MVRYQQINKLSRKTHIMVQYTQWPIQYIKKPSKIGKESCNCMVTQWTKNEITFPAGYLMVLSRLSKEI